MKVLVAGAGIAGLTAAITLARSGHTVDVHEQSTALDEIGAGIQISPNAFHVLADLGLGERLQAEATQVEAIELRDGRNGRVIAQVPFGDVGRARYGAPYCVLHRGRLQRILLDAAMADPAISLHLGSPAPRHVTGALTVAADGYRSAIRESATGIFAESSGKTAWRTMIPQDSWPAIGSDRIIVWMAPAMHLVAYPLAGDRKINLVAIGDTANSGPGSSAGGPSAWIAKFCRHLQPRLESWSAWPIHRVDAPMAIPSQQLAIIGDAAHAMEPYAAQGGALAIEDAWVLAQSLARHSENASALEAFRRARTARVMKVRYLARRNGRIYHLASVAASARNFALAAIAPPRLLAAFDWLYGWRP